MALTKGSIDRATYRGNGKTQDIRWDDALSGFGLRVFPSGAKSFVIKYRTSNRRVRLASVGKYGVLTVDQARKRARKMLVEVSDGIDPIEERKREKIPTLREHAPEYLAYIRLHNKSWQESARRLGFRYVNGTFEPNKEHPGNILPTLGSRPLTEIRPKDVERLHTKMGDTPYEANRTVALLSALLSHGLPAGAVNPAAVQTESRRDGIRLFPEKPRRVYVKQEEMPRLVKAIEEEPNVFVRGVVWLALLTSCRQSELLPRTWKEVDFEQGTLQLPNTKSGRDRTVALTDAALKVLAELPRYRDNAHLFPGSRPGTHLTKDALKKPWTAIRKRAGLSHTTFHDLRRVFGSWSIQEGMPIAFISAALGHSSIRVTEKAYAHLTPAEPRKALEAHSERLLKVVEGGKA